MTIISTNIDAKTNILLAFNDDFLQKQQKLEDFRLNEIFSKLILLRK